MKRLFIASAAVVATLAGSPALAEVLTPMHGGQVVEVNERHVELVAKDGVVEVYIADHNNKPIATDSASGKATQVVDGKKVEVALSSAGGNKLVGASPLPNPKASTVVNLTLGGKSISARFPAAK